VSRPCAPGEKVKREKAQGRYFLSSTAQLYLLSCSHTPGQPAVPSHNAGYTPLRVLDPFTINFIYTLQYLKWSHPPGAIPPKTSSRRPIGSDHRHTHKTLPAKRLRCSHQPVLEILSARKASAQRHESPDREADEAVTREGSYYQVHRCDAEDGGPSLEKVFLCDHFPSGFVYAIK